MANVYDAIKEFYENDPDWELILSQYDVENFFRHMAWQGTTDEQMQRQWKYIVMLCIYLENAELELFDLTEDNLVDLVSWCGRNVADFSITFAAVKELLETLGQFFVFLKKDGIVESSLPPYLAMQQLLRDDGTVAIIDEEGYYLPGEESREETAAPPAEGRVFLNAEEALNGLMKEIHQFFQRDEFNLDFERAMLLYETAMGPLDPSLVGAEADYFWQGFWDYFLFDYHLLLGDQIPLRYFKKHGGSQYPQLVSELCQGFLALFTIEDVVNENHYVCRDFITGEPYFFTFYLEEEEPLEDLVMLGHVFYNQSIGMNYLQRYRLRPLARKRLLEVLDDCLKWYDVHCPGAHWEEFVERHALLCRKVLQLAGENPALLRFSHDTAQWAYQPPLLPEKLSNVEVLLQSLLLGTGRSHYDVHLCRCMWQDFLKCHPHTELYPFPVWAAAIGRIFRSVNEAQHPLYRMPSRQPLGISEEQLEGACKTISHQLQLEPFDPRYLDELGFLQLFSSSKQELEQ